MKRFSVNRRSRGLLVAAGAVLAGVAGFGVLQWQSPKLPDELTLAEAGLVGPSQIYQLAIQIEKPKDGAADGGFERGDIIVVAPAEKVWSSAEREGFLIIKMRLTEAQANLLSLPKVKPIGWFARLSGQPTQPEREKSRRYTVDFGVLGAGEDDERGRVIEGQVFDPLVSIREK